ncbi:GD17062 [Drosophila simulans]|uniref:GD17062 n=1 Tax=Drosophila simulans TaxID=7240 RepID=B4R3L6_DROSI|nr:GD17062 [Drosophila simulans]
MTGRESCRILGANPWQCQSRGHVKQPAHSIEVPSFQVAMGYVNNGFGLGQELGKGKVVLPETSALPMAHSQTEAQTAN